jgi:hypothetical protein
VALILCGECSNSFSDKAQSCPTCGAPNVETSNGSLRGSDQVFFSDRGVKVTTSLFSLPGSRTFAMSGVTSVRMWEKKPSRLVPILLGCLSLLLCVALPEHGAKVFWGLLTIASLVWFVLLKPTYIVVLNTASGESQALKDKSRQWIQRVVDALNECIVHRG